MDGGTRSHAGPPLASADCAGPFGLARPDRQLLPLVVASPHSGSVYPRDFLEASPLDLDLLRRTEDCHVDRLAAGAVEVGAPLLRAHFSRAFLDVNREPWELDPAMFAEPLPDYVKTRSPHIAAGLGTIPPVGRRRAGHLPAQAELRGGAPAHPGPASPLSRRACGPAGGDPPPLRPGCC